MGKKYDAYSQAAKAETQAAAAYVEAKALGDVSEIQHAQTNYHQNVDIANALWSEVMEDPEG